MSSVRVGPENQVILPREVRTRLGVRPGDYVEIAMTRDRAVLKRRKAKSRDEEERIGPKMRAAIRRGLRAAAEGRVSKPLRTAEEVQAHLDALKK